MTTDVVNVERELSPETLRFRKATKSAIRHAFMNALAEAISPDEIAEAFRDAVQYAREKRDAKSLAIVLDLFLGYAIGKPQPFEERDSIDIDKILSSITISATQRYVALTTPTPITGANIDATGESIEIPT